VSRRSRRWGTGLILTGLLALPAAAQANAYTEVQQVYAASGTAQIPACQFSSPELEAALKQAPSYDYEYQSDFTDAVEGALAARATGDCATAGSGAVPRGSLGPGSHLSAVSSQLPGSLTAAGSGALPPVLLVGFVLVGALLLGLAGWLGLGPRGHEPRVLQGARQALREAEYRIGAGWTDLTDRLRR
jgi:hypothetical protein